jgi:hypothetical protein
MTAIRPRNRLGFRIAIRAIGRPAFARATALLKIPPPHLAGEMHRRSSALQGTPSALAEGVQPDACLLDAQVSNPDDNTDVF